MKLSNLSVNRPVAVLMAVLVVLLLGAVSLTRLAIDLWPDLNFPVALIITDYEGVGPEEIEKLVTRPIEGQIGTINGVKKISSESSPGSSVVVAEFNWGSDMDQKTIKMREKVDFIKPYLPEGVGEPMIFKMSFDLFPIMMLGISGDQDLAELKQIIEDKIQPRLERIDGVASVNLTGEKTREIHVEIDPQKLEAYNLSITDVSNTIRGENNNTSGGFIEQSAKDYLVRVKGEFTNLHDLENILIPLKSGGTIKLKDLAEIKNTYKETKQYSLLNGVPSIGLNIQKQSDANTVKVSDAVKKELEKIKKELPPNIQIKEAFDQAEFIRKAINRVVSNGYIGAVLAVIVLFLFLRSVRSTLIIGTAIPISIITTFILVYFGGLTLNMMSLGGLALGIGMMVDSAIVILENIYRHRQEGYGRIEAAKLGASEVGTAVIASTLTTVAVFLPIVYVEGLASQIFRPLALTVSFSLIASLIVALSLIPMLASKLLTVENNGNDHGKPKNLMQRLSKMWANTLAKLDIKYQGLLQWALRRRKTVIFTTLAAFILSVAAIPMVGMEFLPKQDNGYFTVDIKLPNSSVLEETTRVVNKVEKVVASMPEVESIFLSVGNQAGMLTGGFGEGTHLANIVGRLVPLRERDRGVEEVMDDIRSQLTDIPGAEITVKADDSSMGGSQSPISVIIKGHDLEELKDIAQQFADKIKQIPGTREVATSLEKGNPELAVKVDREKAARYGVSSYQVSQTVRAGLQGALSSKYRTGGEEIDIRVQIPEANRNNIQNLNRLMVPSMLGFNVPLEEIAKIEYNVGPTKISRVNQSRQVTVTGDIFGRDLRSVTEDIKKVIADIPLPVGYEYEIGGANKEMMESFQSLGLALVLAIIIVYMILAAQFEALLYPFIIMFSVPPTLIGIVGGLLITGRTFSVPTFIGVIMLAGIVVNNAIVLVDYINTLRKRGMEKTEAILKAGPTRLRPILMTTLTTVLALMPQALGIGEGAEVSAPMATAVVAGLSFSTLITLVLIPVMYYILDDWGKKITARFTKTVTGETVSERV
ncbi:MAG: hydrophobic/amphiphilic exporter (mainly bacteria), family [Clostridia bacterium]|jgi:HAE1 family hydrophobic/amphiphilic exporter-1|nr:hydrophobic/amphiphilic exporter (mainly bacteria), family [Clostridia bacterium]